MRIARSEAHRRLASLLLAAALAAPAAMHAARAVVVIDQGHTRAEWVSGPAAGCPNLRALSREGLTLQAVETGGATPVDMLAPLCNPPAPAILLITPAAEPYQTRFPTANVFGADRSRRAWSALTDRMGLPETFTPAALEAADRVQALLGDTVAAPAAERVRAACAADMPPDPDAAAWDALKRSLDAPARRTVAILAPSRGDPLERFAAIDAQLGALRNRLETLPREERFVLLYAAGMTDNGTPAIAVLWGPGVPRGTVFLPKVSWGRLCQAVVEIERGKSVDLEAITAMNAPRDRSVEAPVR